MSAPASVNIGYYTYTNADEITDTASHKYVFGGEGRYIGCRYNETRDEETDVTRGKASSATGAKASATQWKYQDVVQYAFGYGMSYSNFTQTIDSVTENSDTITVNVKVKNNSDSRPGKDVVQVYTQAPYKPNSGVEKFAVQLAGFGKTKELAVNAEEVVPVVIKKRDLASYDYKTEKTYILDAGTYYISVGNDAHDALNNILAKKGKSTTNGMTKNGNADMVREHNVSTADYKKYAQSETKAEISNKFDDVDLNTYMSDAVT